MPRNYSRSRRTRRKSAWYDKKYSARTLAVKALKNVNYIRGLVNSELFKRDITGSTVVDNTGTVIPFAGIPQADTDNARTGNSILVKSWYLKLAINQNTAAVNTLYRIMLVQDEQQISDTSPTISDILDTTSTLAPLSGDTVGRFKILKNSFFHTSNARDTVREMNIFVKMFHHVRYNGPASTDIQRGGLYLVMLSDQAVGTAPTIFYNSRLSYHDN